MTRVQRTLVLALAVLGVGGGAAAWVYTQGYGREPERRTQEIRAARLFDWGRFHIREFTLENGRTRISGACTEKAGCRLTAPFAGPADQEATQALLDNIAALSFHNELASGDEARSQLGQFGLADPPITFTATTTDGRVHRLRVGAKNSVDGRRFVAGGEPLRLGSADDTFAWALDRDLFGFRAKQVFELARDQIVKVTIEKVAVPPRALVVSRGEPLWTASTGDRTVNADPFVIDRFLVLLTRDLKADAFVTDALTPDMLARFGLDRPVYRLSVETKSGHVERAVVGAAPRLPGTAAPDEDGALAPYVHIEGSTTVSVVYPALLTDLDKTADDFRDRRVLDFDYAAARRLEVTHAGQPPMVFEGENKAWRLVSPVTGTAKHDRMGALLLRFSKLRATKTIEDTKTPARSKALGFDPPVVRVVVRGAGEVVLADLSVGAPADAKTTHVTAAGTGRIDTVPDGELRLIPQSPDDILVR